MAPRRRPQPAWPIRPAAPALCRSHRRLCTMEAAQATRERKRLVLLPPWPDELLVTRRMCRRLQIGRTEPWRELRTRSELRREVQTMEEDAARKRAGMRPVHRPSWPPRPCRCAPPLSRPPRPHPAHPARPPHRPHHRPSRPSPPRRRHTPPPPPPPPPPRRRSQRGAAATWDGKWEPFRWLGRCPHVHRRAIDAFAATASQTLPPTTSLRQAASTARGTSMSRPTPLLPRARRSQPPPTPLLRPPAPHLRRLVEARIRPPEDSAGSLRCELLHVRCSRGRGLGRRRGRGPAQLLASDRTCEPGAALDTPGSPRRKT